jgi:threonine/homoserine/homoserine lactone efflux protein
MGDATFAARRIELPPVRAWDVPIDAHLLVLFTLATAVAMVAPGPDMLFILGCAVRGGPRAGLLATAGVATSEAVHIAVAAAGLAALFAAVPTAFAVVRLVGAAYLGYLGVRLLIRPGGGDTGAAGDGTVSDRRAYLRGLVTNLLNPKMVTFTIAFLPQFINPALGHVWVQFTILGVIMLTLEFLVDGTVGVLGGRIGSWLQRRQRARRHIDRATGTLFVALGARLATHP